MLPHPPPVSFTAYPSLSWPLVHALLAASQRQSQAGQPDRAERLCGYANDLMARLERAGVEVPS